MPSTLEGYTPKVGDRVWQQMYSPQKPSPDSCIEERVAFGSLYGPRRLMEVVYVEDGYDSTAYARSLGMAVPVRIVTKWVLQHVDPRDRRGEYPFSSVESDWCVLELDESSEWQESLL